VKLAGVNISMIRDPQVAYKMFYEGKLDLIGDPLSPLPLDKIKIVDRAQELVCKDVSRLFLLHCNTQVYPLNNANLRRALNAALDRRQLVERVFIKQRPHASPLPTKYSFLEEEEQFDPDKAMHYFETALKELNLDCQTFPPLTLTYSELSYERPLFAELESQWRQRLGITLLSKELPWSEFFEALSSGNFELGGLFRRNVFNHPMSYLSFYNHSPLWENKEFQQLLKNLDQDKTLKKIEQFLMREMPVIPLVNQRYLILKHPRIKGVEWLDNGSLDLTRAWIDENY
jgi:oligopeptide transport system substrate-binding protein